MITITAVMVENMSLSLSTVSTANGLVTKPTFVLVYWDSKSIQLVSGRREERVAVLISGSVEGYTPK